MKYVDDLRRVRAVGEVTGVATGVPRRASRDGRGSERAARGDVSSAPSESESLLIAKGLPGWEGLAATLPKGTVEERSAKALLRLSAASGAPTPTVVRVSCLCQSDETASKKTCACMTVRRCKGEFFFFL